MNEIKVMIQGGGGQALARFLNDRILDYAFSSKIDPVKIIVATTTEDFTVSSEKIEFEIVKK